MCIRDSCLIDYCRSAVTHTRFIYYASKLRFVEHYEIVKFLVEDDFSAHPLVDAKLKRCDTAFAFSEISVRAPTENFTSLCRVRVGSTPARCNQMSKKSVRTIDEFPSSRRYLNSELRTFTLRK